MLSTQRVKHVRVCFCALSTLLALAAPVSAEEQTPGSGHPVHYLVLEADAQGGVHVSHHHQTVTETPPETLSDSEFAALAALPTTRQHDAAAVQLFDAAGNLTFQTVVEVPRWLRGEFLIDDGRLAAPADESNIDGHHLALEQRSFVVRVPVTEPGATLHVQPTFATTGTVIDLDQAAGRFAGFQPAAAGVVEFIPGRNMGPSDNRLDILVLGDGYQSSEENKFKADTELLINNFMAIGPYADYANFVNVRRVFTVSQQSGADRPTCPDPAAGTNDDNTFVDTAFDATFCTYNIWRLLTVNVSKVLAAAAADPNWDKILVVVNTPLYGGSGGSLAVGSLHTQAVQIMQHEFGHTFTRLADEYTSSYPGYPACSDTNASNVDDCEPNVTDQTTRSLIKWNRWISPATPIPTTGPLPDPLAAGLWEGARYQTTGMFRQGYNCLMRTLGTQFCTVEREAYALRLYGGGWGKPSLGIKNFEQPYPANSVVWVSAGRSMGFSARVLGPISGPAATVRWLLDGVVVKEENTDSGATTSYSFGPRPSGYYSLTLEVADPSPIIHNTMRPVSRRIWDIEVGADSEM
jgi:hypothetical protein